MSEKVDLDADAKDEDKPKWASRISNKLNSVERPQKITRDDVLDRWDDTYERRQELLQEAKKPSTIAKVITAGALGIAVLSGLSSYMGQGHYDSQSKANDQQISGLKSQLSSAQTSVKQVPTTVDAAKFITDANSQGKAMADLQNKMIDANRKNDKNSAEKVASYSPQLASHLDGDAKFASSLWYSIVPDKTVNTKHWNTQYQWTAQPPYAFGNNGQDLQVVWLCHEKGKNTLLAWAIGDYSSQTKKFEGMSWGSTDIGQSYVGTQIDNDKGTK